MKILTIAATPFFSDRGCHLRIYNEACGLKKNGHQIRILTYHNGKNFSDMEIFRIKNVPWYKKTSPGFAWGKIWLDWKLLLLTKKQLKLFSPDILHCHLYEGLAIGFFANFLTGKKIPLLADLQGDLAGELKNYNQKNFLARRLFSLFAGFFLKKATAVIVSSQRGGEVLKKKYSWLKNLTVVEDSSIMNFPEESINETVKKELAKIRSWQKDSFLLIYAGGLSGGKGLRKFFDFFGNDFIHQTKWKFLIFGSGEDRKYYQKKIREKNLQKLIFLAEENSFSQLPDYLKLATVGLEPKNNSTESSGKLSVYISADLPVLCFDNSFNRAKLEDTGLYFNNFEEIQEKLSTVVSIKKTAHIGRNFNNQKEILKLEKILQKILTKND